MTNNQDACRVMADKIADELEEEDVWLREMDTEDDKNFRHELFAIIRNHTAYPDVLGALEEAQHALSGDKRQRVDNALAKAKGEG